MLSAFLRLFILILAGFILAQIAAAGIVIASGGEISDSSLSTLSASTMKLMLLASHLLTFILPCFLFIFLNYKEHMWKTLRLDRPFALGLLPLCMLFVVVSYPAVSYSYTVNSWLPLADWMLSQEESTAATLEKVLTMPHFGSFLFNLLLIAVIPAIGEELLFRGLIMDFIERSSKNMHLAVWGAAIAFSLFHLQFQGFLPRLLLGALLGYCFIFTRNFLVPIILHFLNNAVPIVGLYFFDTDLAAINPADSAELHWTVGLGSLMLGIGVGIYLYKKSKLDEFIEA